MKITETYTGSDASLEILLMLLGAFLFGYLFRFIYDKYFTECVDEEVEYSQKPEVVENEVPNKTPVIQKNTQPVQSQINLEDDLKVVEGIGPKIEGILKTAGIKTFKDLASTTPEQVRIILKDLGGDRYAFHDPTTWPDQAGLAYEGKFAELKEYQEFLAGGRKLG